MDEVTIVVVVGTTGVGKSKLALEIAARCNGELINADAMQMYQGCDVATNKETIPGVSQHLLSVLPADTNDYNVRAYRADADAAIADVVARGALPVVCGGTVQYLEALLFPLLPGDESAEAGEDCAVPAEDDIPPVDMPAVAAMDSDARYALLEAVDPGSARILVAADTRRVLRALEYTATHDHRYSSLLKHQHASGPRRFACRYRALCLWPLADLPRCLDARLDARVDDMLARDMLEELCEAWEATEAAARERGLWQAIGVKEFRPWLEHRGTDASPVDVAAALADPGNPLSACVEKQKGNTRRYARKQLKFLRTRFLGHTGMQMAVLDADDVNAWETHVLRPALHGVRLWTGDDTSEASEAAAAAWRRGLERADAMQHAREESRELRVDWERHVCVPCGGRVLRGARELRQHQQGRSHRRALKKMRKREAAKRKRGASPPNDHRPPPLLRE